MKNTCEVNEDVTVVLELNVFHGVTLWVLFRLADAGIFPFTLFEDSLERHVSACAQRQIDADKVSQP